MSKHDLPNPRAVVPADIDKSLSLPEEMVNRGLVLATKLELKSINKGNQIPLKQCPGSFSPACISFSKNGKFALITDYGNHVSNPPLIIWNAMDKSRIITLALEEKAQNFVFSTALSKNGEFALVGYSDGHVLCWDIKRHVGRCFSPTDSNIAHYKDEFILSAIFSPHQTFSVERTSSLPPNPIPKHPNRSVTSIIFSPDGLYYAECTGNYLVRIREIMSGKETQRFPVGYLNYYNQMAFSHDGKKLIVARGEPTNRQGGMKSLITLFDLTGKQEPLMFGGNRIINAVAVDFFPDNKKVLSLESRGVITLWNAQDGKEILHWSHVKSPDDANDLISRKEISENLYIEQRNPMIWGLSSVAVSPDGNRVLSGGGDTFMRLWNLKGHQICEYPHNTRVVNVAFTSDGQRALSGCWDGSVYLWEVPQ